MFVILSEAKDLKIKDRVKSDRMFEMFRFAQHDRVRRKFIHSTSDLSFSPISSNISTFSSKTPHLTLNFII